ncbi:MAG: DUF1513 domain-containing protein, partial [Siculibacillus sp.]|nr:DUF1513 domain-containing protein [Siculibacillus sp.]
MTATDRLLDRRRLLAVLGALPFATLVDGVAAAAAPAGFASARFDASGASVALFGEAGETAAAPLPDRGHGLAIAPDGRSLVVVARRPGRWAAIFSLPDLRLLRRLALPAGRHFYG